MTGVPVFEGFRHRNQPESSPWPEPSPEAPPEPADLEVYLAPRRSGPGAGGIVIAEPSATRPDLDPQRLDGRSAAATRPGQPTTRPGQPTTRPGQPAARDADRMLLDVLEDPSREADPPKKPAAGRPAVRRFSPATVDGSGIDVETRPSRAYPVRWPDASRETRVRPEYHGVGVLRAAGPTRGRMRTRGLGLMFPPHTVHARDSASVLAGDICELAQVDHVHIRQAVVAPDDALRSGPVREILARVRPGRDATDAVHELRGALAGPAAAGAPASRQPRADCRPSLHRARTIQLGDDTMTRLDPRYVVERTIVPAGALLAADEELARRYLAVVTGAPDDPGALAGFLGDLVGAAANAVADNVLGYADGLPDQRATVLGLFGMVTVDPATSVMIGAG
jgi:hypothetical protein